MGAERGEGVLGGVCVCVCVSVCVCVCVGWWWVVVAVGGHSLSEGVPRSAQRRGGDRLVGNTQFEFPR